MMPSRWSRSITFGLVSIAFTLVQIHYLWIGFHSCSMEAQQKEKKQRKKRV